MTAGPRDSKKRKHRILISGGMADGGMQTHVVRICHLLLQVGAEVTIASASTNWPRQAIDELKAVGVKFAVSSAGFGFFSFLGKIIAFLTWPFLLRRDYDVLYCVGRGRMHRWAGRFVGKSGWKIYHEIVDCPPRGTIFAEVAGEMDALVANSQSIGREMSELFRSIPVRTIPFLTSDASVPPPRQRAAVSGELRIAFLGRMVEHKNPHLLIEAMRVWNTGSPIGPVRLDLYGGVYDAWGQQLQKRIDELDLGNSVRLHGAYSSNDLAAIFDATDLVVLPSRFEGLPLVLVEAMQRGIPVVATSAGGTAELGDENPDVIITEETDWHNFEAGVKKMAGLLRSGEIDGVRLHEWTEARYGFPPVAEAWTQALLTPEIFFAEKANSAVGVNA